MALATSVTSARVGEGERIMLSSICVAVMAVTLHRFARRMICFW